MKPRAALLGTPLKGEPQMGPGPQNRLDQQTAHRVPVPLAFHKIDFPRHTRLAFDAGNLPRKPRRSGHDGLEDAVDRHRHVDPVGHRLRASSPAFFSISSCLPGNGRLGILPDAISAASMRGSTYCSGRWYGFSLAARILGMRTNTATGPSSGSDATAFATPDQPAVRRHIMATTGPNPTPQTRLQTCLGTRLVFTCGTRVSPSLRQNSVFIPTSPENAPMVRRAPALQRPITTRRCAPLLPGANSQGVTLWHEGPRALKTQQQTSQTVSRTFTTCDPILHNAVVPIATIFNPSPRMRPTPNRSRPRAFVRIRPPRLYPPAPPSLPRKLKNRHPSANRGNCRRRCQAEYRI